MKAFVTGGAGFIGSHITQELCRRGSKVVILDNLSTGDEKNLAWAGNGDEIEFVKGDVRDTDLIRKLTEGCEWVFHEAAQPSVPLSIEKPVETHEENLDASLQMLVAARDFGVKRFMFASSSAVYGDALKPIKQETDGVCPISPYGLQKYAAERYGVMFHQFYGLEAVSFRYFNVFGPRQSFNSPYSGVIAKFCTSILEGNAPFIFGDGKQSRDFVFVENVVNANLLAAEGDSAKVAGKVFNVACGGSIDLLQLAAELNKLTDQSLEPVHKEARAGDIKDSQADISEARAGLGYEPEVSFAEGLKETLDFYRE